MIKLLKGRENIVALIVGILGVACTYWGAGLTKPYNQSVAANMGTGLIGLGIGIFLINVYFDYGARRRAVKPLLKLIAPSIAEHHNEMITDAGNAFGMQAFESLMNSYVTSDGRINTLSPEQIQRLNQMITARKAVHDDRFRRLDNDLKELSHVLGWSFDSDILRSAFACRCSIGQFLGAPVDNTPESAKALCEHYLDTSLHAHAVFHQLVQLIGLPPNEVYSPN